MIGKNFCNTKGKFQGIPQDILEKHDPVSKKDQKNQEILALDHDSVPKMEFKRKSIKFEVKDIKEHKNLLCNKSISNTDTLLIDNSANTYKKPTQKIFLKFKIHFYRHAQNDCLLSQCFLSDVESFISSHSILLFSSSLFLLSNTHSSYLLP